jgi:hypothetical protein
LDGETKLSFGKEWPTCYFPAAFPFQVRVEVGEKGVGLWLGGTVTSKTIGCYFLPDTPGNFAVLRFEPGTFLTPETLHSLEYYLGAMKAKGRPPLFLGGMPPEQMPRFAEWCAKGLVLPT